MMMHIELMRATVGCVVVLSEEQLGKDERLSG